MKKVVLGLTVISVLFANAEMTESERGLAIGLGTGYAQAISMENPNYMKEDLLSLCLYKVDSNDMLKKRGNDSITLAANECVSQLKRMGSNIKK